MNKKIIIAILTAIVLILAGLYFIYQRYYFSPIIENNLESKIKKPSEISKPEPENQTSGYKLYKNAEFGFEIQYPSSWTVTEEINENVRGEMIKEFFFKKPGSDLRFAILPRDGLSYGVGAKGTTTPVLIGGSSGMQTQYILKDSRRLWLIFPRFGLHNWLEDLGRIDVMTSAESYESDTRIFEQMLNSFKLLNI